MTSLEPSSAGSHYEIHTHTPNCSPLPAPPAHMYATQTDGTYTPIRINVSHSLQRQLHIRQGDHMVFTPAFFLSFTHSFSPFTQSFRPIGVTCLKINMKKLIQCLVCAVLCSLSVFVFKGPHACTLYLEPTVSVSVPCSHARYEIRDTHGAWRMGMGTGMGMGMDMGMGRSMEDEKANFHRFSHKVGAVGSIPSSIPVPWLAFCFGARVRNRINYRCLWSPFNLQPFKPQNIHMHFSFFLL